MDGPGIDAVYEEYLLVLRFEREEAETMDLPPKASLFRMNPLLSNFSVQVISHSKCCTKLSRDTVECQKRPCV